MQVRTNVGGRLSCCILSTAYEPDTARWYKVISDSILTGGCEMERGLLRSGLSQVLWWWSNVGIWKADFSESRDEGQNAASRGERPSPLPHLGPPTPFWVEEKIVQTISCSPESNSVIMCSSILFCYHLEFLVFFFLPNDPYIPESVCMCY